MRILRKRGTQKDGCRAFTARRTRRSRRFSAMRLSPLDPLRRGFIAGIAFAHMFAGRFEQGIEWADRCLREEPRFTLAMRCRMVCCAHLGRIEEAREWLERLLAIQPGLTVAKYQANYGTTFPPDIVAMVIEGLRLAGLPEA